MKKERLIYYLIFVCTSLPMLISAQENITSAGGDASGAGGSVSYSVGQTVYTTNTGTTGSVAQGVQQPYEISVVSNLNLNSTITLECSIYPNPATDYLLLEVKGQLPQNLSYLLYDNNGKQINNVVLTENQTKICLEGLSPATYFVKILSDNQELKIFKIVKN